MWWFISLCFYAVSVGFFYLSFKDLGFLLKLWEYGKLGLWDSFYWSFNGGVSLLLGGISLLLGVYPFRFKSGDYFLIKDFIEFLIAGTCLLVGLAFVNDLTCVPFLMLLLGTLIEVRRRV